MSGGYFDYAGRKIAADLKSIGNDPAMKELPVITQCLLGLAEAIKTIEHDIDYHLSGDTRIDDVRVFDNAAAGLLLDVILRELPDELFERGKWATIQSWQERTTSESPVAKLLKDEDVAIWECKIGGVQRNRLSPEDDGPLRIAVERAYQELIGKYSLFCFSGWGGKLTNEERECVGLSTADDESSPTLDQAIAEHDHDRGMEAMGFEQKEHDENTETTSANSVLGVGVPGDRSADVTSPPETKPPPECKHKKLVYSEDKDEYVCIDCGEQVSGVLSQDHEPGCPAIQAWDIPGACTCGKGYDPTCSADTHNQASLPLTCPECGPVRYTDEDGCCTMCGVDVPLPSPPPQDDAIRKAIDADTAELRRESSPTLDQAMREFVTQLTTDFTVVDAGGTENLPFSEVPAGRIEADLHRHLDHAIEAEIAAKSTALRNEMVDELLIDEDRKPGHSKIVYDKERRTPVKQISPPTLDQAMQNAVNDIHDPVENKIQYDVILESIHRHLDPAIEAELHSQRCRDGYELQKVLDHHTKLVKTVQEYLWCKDKSRQQQYLRDKLRNLAYKKSSNGGTDEERDTHQQERGEQEILPHDNPYVGWTIISVGTDGSLLLESPTKNHRRVWFNEILSSDIEKIAEEKTKEAHKYIGEWKGSPASMQQFLVSVIDSALGKASTHKK